MGWGLFSRTFDGGLVGALVSVSVFYRSKRDKVHGLRVNWCKKMRVVVYKPYLHWSVKPV